MQMVVQNVSLNHLMSYRLPSTGAYTNTSTVAKQHIYYGKLIQTLSIQRSTKEAYQEGCKHLIQNEY